MIIERKKGGSKHPEPGIQQCFVLICVDFLTRVCMYVYVHIHAHVYEHVSAPASPSIQIYVVILFLLMNRTHATLELLINILLYA